MFSAAKTRAASSAGYSVGKSLRFRSSASAYLNRTFGTPTNNKIFTWSGWLKFGTINSSLYPVLFGVNTGTDELLFGGSGGSYPSQLIYNMNGAVAANITTSQTFRDPSAWYHIMVAVDTTQATASNRIKLYVNGAQVTALATSTYPSQNYTPTMNSAVSHQIGNDGTGRLLDGYLAEVNFIDGQALTPSSFGAYDTNGVWQPAKYSGSFGTNGFYLNFGNTTSTTTLGYDTSGNSNNWTTNNISLTAGSTYDSMTDSPTVTSASVANYAVLNPVVPQPANTWSLSNGNLNLSEAYQGAPSTISMSSGKWYWEITPLSNTSSVNMRIGIAPQGYPIGNNTPGDITGSYAYVSNGQKASGGTYTSYGATFTDNDVIGIALDLTGGTITFYKNGTSQGTAFSSISGTFFALTGSGSSTANTLAANFGQRPFTYTPPTGFNALNTYNLPSSNVPNGAAYMAATTYTGTGASLTINNGTNTTIGTTFQPDLVWMKSRSAATDHALFDVVRGTTLELISDSTAAETTQATGLTAFGSTGFTIGAEAKLNTSTATYVGWQWKANGAGVSNTNGSITSTVSANTTAGFSVVTFTSQASGTGTVGHGLGVAPSLFIVKQRTAATGWAVYTSSTGNTGYLTLNSTAAFATDANQWANTSPTSSVFTLGLNFVGSVSTVAYCWAAVAGYSAFGSYTGNGSTDGPFIYLGFRPRWIMIKSASQVNQWLIVDTSRDTYNINTNFLAPQSSAAEGSASEYDILSNGFKLRAGDGGWNGSGETLIYAAFAENPLNYSRAR